MKRLLYDEIRQLSGALPEVYAHTDLATFQTFTVDVVQRFVAADLIEYNEIGKDGCVLTQRPTSPEGCQRYPAFEVRLSEHPVHSHRVERNSPGPAKLMAVPIDHAFHGLPGDDRFYRSLGVTDQLGFGFRGPEAAWISVVLNRWSQHFKLRDQLVVEFLQPHLAQAHHNAVLLTESHQTFESLSGAFASMHRGLVRLNAQGQAVWMTQRAQQWLSSYFAEPVRHQQLPSRLQCWIYARRAWQKQNGNLVLPEPLVVSHEHARLIIRFSEDSRGRQFLFLKEEKIGVCPSAFFRLGLTHREGEILYWICQGKSNPEIATMHQISFRTVHKHVEHILAKLNVETRAAAMLTALQALDETESAGQDD